MNIALTNSKGGVGKSTLAVHLVVWFLERGKNVALVDADAQGSSSAWLQEVSPQIPIFRLRTPDDILEKVPELCRKFDPLVIDGPAGLSEVTRAVLLVADRPGPLTLSCGAGHTWMHADVLVLEHGMYTATGRGGAYRLEGVPAGAWWLVAWHPRLGERRVAIQVAAGERTQRQALAY